MNMNDVDDIEGLQDVMRKLHNNDETLKLSLSLYQSQCLLIILMNQSTDKSSQLIISGDIWICLCLPRNVTFCQFKILNRVLFILHLHLTSHIVSLSKFC